jgi:fatty acid desaturase
LRPLPTPAELRSIRLQELGGCLFLWGCASVPPFVFGRPLLVLALHAYLTSVVLILMNSVRTLAAHRYLSDGQEQSFVEQMLDSVTLDNDSLIAVLINPVGLRYHATHHLFPSLPYHNLRAAHKRLMAGLPADSPYRLTVETSLVHVLAKLWRRAAASRRPPSPCYTAPDWKSAASVS